MFKKIILLIILIIFVITLGGCSTPNWYKPNGYLVFRQMPKGGSPGFNLGWIHGCQSGMGSDFGMALGMTFYTWSKDPDISSSNPDIAKVRARYKKELKDVNWDDPEDIKRNFGDYNKIFWSAVSFCKHTILGSLQMSGINPGLPGEARYDPTKHSIGNIWRINARGDTRIGSGGNSMW